MKKTEMMQWAIKGLTAERDDIWDTMIGTPINQITAEQGERMHELTRKIIKLKRELPLADDIVMFPTPHFEPGKTMHDPTIERRVSDLEFKNAEIAEMIMEMEKKNGNH